MYAVVRTGDRQYEVAEGNPAKVEKIEGEPSSSVVLALVLLVDGADAITDVGKLANVTVNAKIIEVVKGPEIRGMHCENKTGYRRRYDHRQPLTVLEITGISK